MNAVTELYLQHGERISKELLDLYADTNLRYIEAQGQVTPFRNGYDIAPELEAHQEVLTQVSGLLYLGGIDLHMRLYFVDELADHSVRKIYAMHNPGATHIEAVKVWKKIQEIIES